ncbi:MAG: hypothetical protein GKS06_12220 [Acidobacteria bacterium]|nr:hypothetical protein [Acidobacteriota bacterium]
MRNNPKALILTVAVFLSPTALAAEPIPQDVPVMVSTEWMSEHLGDANIVPIYVMMAHAGAPGEMIPGTVLLDYHSLEDSSGLPIELPPIDELERLFSRAGVGPNTHVVVYGPAPAHQAARAFVTLEILGHERVSLLDGGIGAWIEEGRATSSRPVRPAPTTFEAQINESILVDAEWIHHRLDDAGLALVDARPRGQFEGATNAALRDGHIPGAGNIFYGEFLEEEAVHRLKPETEVQALLAAAGVDPGDTFVSYCQIAMRASYNYVVARHLGYDVKFYDGSWADWGRRPDLPTETGPAR